MSLGTPGSSRRGAVPRRGGGSLGRCVLVGLLVLHAGPAWAGVNTDFFGTAARGFDVAAYFTRGEAVRGEKAHTVEWAGATWRFASAEHRDLFADQPEQYAPA